MTKKEEDARVYAERLKAAADTIPETKTPVVTKDGMDITAIEDEKTALADTMQQTKGFGWWWLLIMALVGTGSYVGYHQYKKNKEEDSEIQK